MILISQDVSYNQGIFHMLFHTAFSNSSKKHVAISHIFPQGRINLIILCKKDFLFHKVFHRMFHVRKSLTWFSHGLHLGFIGLLPVVTMAATGRSK